ncbi:MAG: hypothetical protein E7042_07635 [Lentisphaerae bacterium]|nr:hypothetical protein [Lentisphaerota bacterium]
MAQTTLLSDITKSHKKVIISLTRVSERFTFAAGKLFTLRSNASRRIFILRFTLVCCANQHIAIRLPDDQSGDWRKPSRPESGAISHSRACFASESRQERTGVRDWRIERRKARFGKSFRLLGVQPNDWRKPSRPESGAISHSRARFAEESARGVYLRTRPERRRPQGALRHSEIAP